MISGKFELFANGLMHAGSCMGVQGCLRAPVHGLRELLHKAEHGV